MRFPGERAVLYGILAFLYLPIVVLLVYSFNDSRFGLTWQGFTLRWYQQLFDRPDIASALKNTLIVSISSTAASALLGTLLGIGLHLYRFPGRRIVDTLFYLPILIPDIIMAIALLAFYVAIRLALGHVSIILAHIAFQVSFVALVVKNRMQEFPQNIVEASQDLGASQIQTLRAVVLPLIRPAVLAGALIAFTLSVDDFLITYFTAGVGASTLPIRIYSMVKRGVTPDINALSSLMLVFTLCTIYFGLKFLYKKDLQ